MRLPFGLTITRTKAAPTNGTLSPPAQRGGWFRILEPFSGAWQRNLETTTESVLSFHAVYACVTLIASDVAKLRIKLVEQDADDIWMEIDSAAFSPVLRTPNHYQTRIQFITQWMLSKLIHGNTYVLKARDGRGVVTSLYVLDPTRVQVLVAPNGDVYYSLHRDDLSRLAPEGLIVPASEIIHDLMPPLYHPLCGVSPITACYLPVIQALRAQQNSASFFANGAKPGGILTSPRILSDEEVTSITKQWEDNFSGDNQGRVAVLGADLKYQDLGVVNAVDSELIDQLKLSGENVCSAYHVPPYKVGIGSAPSYNNVQALNIQYYSDCVQIHIESIEAVLDKGLGLDTIEGKRRGTEFDLDDLFRMDTATLTKAASDAIGSGAVKPNEARKRFFGLGPVAGGDEPYLQQQNFSLAALAKRDQQADPFATSSSAPAAPAAPAGPPGEPGQDGAKGDPGRDGIDGRDGAVGPPGAKGMDGSNGHDGRDGRDGIDFNIKDIVGHVFDGERTLTLKFARDGATYDAELVLSGLPVYQDVWTEGHAYKAGDLVTWGGGMFIAKADTMEKPGLNTDASRAWKLCVKAGRDGKVGKAGPEGPQGPKGEVARW